MIRRFLNVFHSNRPAGLKTEINNANGANINTPQGTNHKPITPIDRAIRVVLSKISTLHLQDAKIAPPKTTEVNNPPITNLAKYYNRIRPTLVYYLERQVVMVGDDVRSDGAGVESERCDVSP